MIPHLRNFELLCSTFAGDSVDHSVLIADAARPPSGQLPLQRLGLPQTFEGITPSLFDQLVDALKQAAVIVVLLPMEIVVPRIVR